MNLIFIVMRPFVYIILILILGLGGCTTTSVIIKSPPHKYEGAKSTAPGQIKKATGAKSAKQYAPGQQKKKNKK